MKKLLFVLPSTLQGGFRGGLLFVALLATTTLWAQSFQVGDLYYNITSETTVEVTRGDYSNLTTATIPDIVTHDGTIYSVTSIGSSAFSGCSSLTSITIPNSVTSIGNNAFYKCSALTSITIPESVTSIGYLAFDYCSALTKTNYTGDIAGWCDIKFGSSNSNPMYYSHNFYINDQEIKDLVIPNTVDSIHNNAFSGCSSLTSITIPNSVMSIGYGAFYNCSALTSITIPNSVTSIESDAFSGTSIAYITIPESVTSIGYSFHGCSSLTTVVWNAHNVQGAANDGPFRDCPIASFTFGEEVKHIPYRLCSGLTLLTSVTIPNSVTSIGDEAFSGCSSLTSVTIGNSVTSIGNRAFFDCSSLTSVTIPNSVTSIERNAFYNCSSLTSVTIPNSVTSIGYDAFSGCSGLASITCEATTPPTLGNGVFYQVSKSIPVYVPCGCVSVYKAAKYWMDFTNIQEPQAEYSIQVSTSNSQMGTAKVDYNNCAGNQITATANYGYHFVQWSDGVTDNPRTLTLTQDTVLTAEFALTTAGQCGKNLYWVYDTNKSTLTITGSGDMYNERPWGLLAANLTEVALPEGLTHIGNDAFTNCNNLKAITIPASVTSIGANSFAGCRNLRNVNCYPLLPPYAETTSFANYNVNLNVPCDYLEDYQYDIVFGSFKYIQCISSDEVEDTEDVEVSAGQTDVTIIWPSEDNAYTYTILIKKNGQVVCTLVFDAYGRLLNIAFAPGRDGNHAAQYAEQTGTGGFRFTVTGLEESTDYTYDITIADESDNTISTHSGEFTTKSNTPTDLDNTDIQYPISDTQKLLRDGQLYIYHNGSTYTIMGAEVK